MPRHYKSYFLHVDCDLPSARSGRGIDAGNADARAREYVMEIEDLAGRRAAIAEATDERPFTRLSFEYKKRESLAFAVCQLIDAMPELARRQTDAEWIVFHIVGPVEGQ